MKTPTLMDMLKSGVHFGHVTSKRHPKMSPFIFGVRSNVHIIDLEITLKKLEEAMSYTKGLAMNNGVILFVATKHQAQSIVKDAAISCGMPYMVDRWIGGLLTNFDEIYKVIKRYHKMKEDIASGLNKNLTKKEQLSIDRQIKRLESMIIGIREMKKNPEAIFIVDLKKEKAAVAEARKVGIPIVAMTDTNVNPDIVTYPIPSNDDATKSIDMITKLIADSINEGKAEQVESKMNPDNS